MVNNVVLVGRVVEDPKLLKTDKGLKVANLVLAVQRPFKNENNQYDTDFIPLQTWHGLAELVCEYVGKGSILGFNCRLSTRNVEVNEMVFKTVEVIAEHVSFIKLMPRSDKNNEQKQKEECFEEEIKEEEE